ncbi:hypothetical protein [Blastococcus sp. SYSU D00695]
MASATTLDVRADRATATPVPRRHPRPPATVLAATALALLEALAVLAAALTGLDGLLTSLQRPPGLLAAGLLVGLAAWAVFGAGGGLVLLDGSGARLLTGVACAELGVCAGVFVLGLTTSAVGSEVAGLPVPALALSASALPVGKLLLATSPSAGAWVDAGPRPRAPQPQLGAGRRVLRAATVVVIGLALVSVALLDPGRPDAGQPAPASTGQH